MAKDYSIEVEYIMTSLKELCPGDWRIEPYKKKSYTIKYNGEFVTGISLTYDMLFGFYLGIKFKKEANDGQ